LYSFPSRFLVAALIGAVLPLTASSAAYATPEAVLSIAVNGVSENNQASFSDPVYVGQVSDTEDVAIKNVGTNPATLDYPTIVSATNGSSEYVSNPDDFLFDDESDCFAGPLNAGDTCHLLVAFAPSVEGMQLVSYVFNPSSTSNANFSFLASAFGTTHTLGYYVATASGTTYSSGRGVYDVEDLPNLNKPIVAAASDHLGGFYEVAADGGIFALNDAQFFGSMGGKPLNKPIVGMTATADGNGYWLVASDGGIFAFGDAQFFGSMGGRPLNKPIVGMTATADGNGYWLVASDGGIFAFGDAQFFGSMGGKPLNKPIVGMTASASGNGYRFVASDGGIFSYGDAQFYGSLGGKTLTHPIVSMAPDYSGAGYFMLDSSGRVFTFGSAEDDGPTWGVLSDAIAVIPAD
jgi:hypothetical protein